MFWQGGETRAVVFFVERGRFPVNDRSLEVENENRDCSVFEHFYRNSRKVMRNAARGISITIESETAAMRMQ